MRPDPAWGRALEALYRTAGLAVVAFLLLDAGALGQGPSASWSLWAYRITLGLAILAGGFSLMEGRRKAVRTRVFDGLFLLAAAFVCIDPLWPALPDLPRPGWWLRGMALLAAWRAWSTTRAPEGLLQRTPGQLLAMSFALIVALGTGLLLLPGSSTAGIGLVDALFTATSATCVTGLVVLDTGADFTRFGQVVILLLIQVGGLGIMTFTSYFAFFFRGGSSYQHRLMLQGLTGTRGLRDVFQTLSRILLLTLLVEAVGTLLILGQLPGGSHPEFREAFFFSVFHAVSAFCNAGFSTLGQGLYDPAFRQAYGLHLILMGLFVVGGIGFPITFNFFSYLRYWIVSRMHPERCGFRPWVVHWQTRLILVTTGILLLGGWLAFLALEWHHALAEHGMAGKLVTGLFGAATPRTAGFNTVDTGALQPVTLGLVLLLMWIGASPGSTGGGIKTTTLAVSWLNLLALVRGRTRVEAFGRQVSPLAMQRAFAVVFFSLLFLLLAFLCLRRAEPGMADRDLLFETVSAFSTVGLSTGITAALGAPAKLILTIVMFAGRLGTLTLLSLAVRAPRSHPYQLPHEDVSIN